MKVLIYQEIVPHYRKPIFDRLGKLVDLTIAYTGKTAVAGDNYKLEKVGFIKIPKVGTIRNHRFLKLLAKTDVLIAPLQTDLIDIDYLRIIAPKVKLIRWGIGVASGYDHRYDDDPSYVYQLFKIINKADAALFYTDYPMEKYIKLGVDKEKLFVAHNTVEVKYNGIQGEDARTKDMFLFIGTLYREKGVDVLINEYVKAHDKCPGVLPLVIIGDGDERKKLEALVETANLNDKVIFKGRIEDEQLLADYFKQALMCISPNQAGLSVLKSMGYGVPFVTMSNAITGGEILNIVDKKSGLLLSDFSEISAVIADATKNRDKYVQYGIEAQKYYNDCRRPEHMVNGFIKAIHHVMQAK